MNCPLNSELNQKELDPFYISEKPVPDFILPKDIACNIYHPLTLNGSVGITINSNIKIAIVEFINNNDCTESGNVTELSAESFERFLSIPSFVGVLYQNEKIIGTMFTAILRVGYQNQEILSSYTTFLCIDKHMREKGLAMILIRAIMKEGGVKERNIHNKKKYLDRKREKKKKIKKSKNTIHGLENRRVIII